MARRARLLSVPVLALGLAAGAALAFAAPAGQTAGAAKPAVQPIVTITKVDGTTVRCQLVDSDGRHLTIKPSDGKTFGEPIELAWADVKSISNGLTRKKAQDAWLAAHNGELCDACHGEPFLPCDVCKGTGHDPASSKDCKTCKGEMLVDCPDKRCDKGKVPCPGPCVKLTEGTWVPDESGKRWRTFNGTKRGAWLKLSEGHAGEIVKVVDGIPRSVGNCEICGKTGKVTCPTCHGRGNAACPTCKADKTAADCTACEDGTKACATCGGSGLKGGAAPAGGEPVAGEPAAPVTPAAPASNSGKSTGDGLD